MTERETAESECHDLRGEVLQLRKIIRDIEEVDIFGAKKSVYLAKMRFHLQACETRIDELQRLLAH
jgi:hypothetical protein